MIIQQNVYMHMHVVLTNDYIKAITMLPQSCELNHTSYLHTKGKNNNLWQQVQMH